VLLPTRFFIFIKNPGKSYLVVADFKHIWQQKYALKYSIFIQIYLR
jgi:hypothetical protein